MWLGSRCLEGIDCSERDVPVCVDVSLRLRERDPAAQSMSRPLKKKLSTKICANAMPSRRNWSANSGVLSTYF